MKDLVIRKFNHKAYPRFHKSKLLHITICSILSFSIFIHMLPITAYAEAIFTYPSFEYTGTHTIFYSSSANSKNYREAEKKYVYDRASSIDEMIAICRKYTDLSATTGIRSQINWMNQLYLSAVSNFVSNLDLGDTLLLAVLNHSDINTLLMTSSYSTGDINREVAKKIVEGAEGYVDVEAIAKATGLTTKEVRSILERIASGSITASTIAVGKNRSRASSRGVYVNHQALKQDKVYQYLTSEVERMTSDPESLAMLYQDLGTGYVDNMLSGYELDKYQVSLYKKHLAETLDNVLESENPISISAITKSESYKFSKNMKSVFSKLYKHEMAAFGKAQDETLSDELRTFLQNTKKNGVFSESEAREYLILSGQYEKGEHGIGEAAKILSNGYKYIAKLEAAMEVAGKVFDVVDMAKKLEEYFDYWLTNYAEQEIVLDSMIEDLSISGADMELMAAARDLKQDYEDKLSGTLDKVYPALIKKGIGYVKSAFPPLGIAESCISLAGTITGGTDKTSALETGFAMQGICKQSLEDYENAVIAVANGDTSDEAVSRVLTAFETARQALISYYKALVQLAETKDDQNKFEQELERLEKAECGYVTVTLPFGDGH